MSSEKPLVVQGDHTILVEVHHPRFEEARRELSQFAELQKSPEFVHFYRITPISIWNAAAIGIPLDGIRSYLVDASRYPVASKVIAELERWYDRYGKLRFVATDVKDRLLMETDDETVLDELCESTMIGPLLDVEHRVSKNGRPAAVRFPSQNRGALKHCLIKLGYPVQDEAGYVTGAPLEFALADRIPSGESFGLRAYQRAAADAFHASGAVTGGCGVVVLPCGAGKTVVGMAVMELVQRKTLILTTNTVAVRQWKRELLEKTSLTEDDIGEYTGDEKLIRPVTIATYQILTYRKRKVDPFLHFRLLESEDWGLIVYDEVHLLPAPIFRATAAIQGLRRLGLTATLVREDGKEGDVFSLIGPKRYDLGWKDLEKDGYLAEASCVEVRVPMTVARANEYAVAGARARLKIASTNEGKTELVGALLKRHCADRVLVIGQYLDQLRKLATIYSLPLITGKTPMAERERLFGAFRDGDISVLCVSKVGNFAIDLPDANVAIQVSGTFGSRQEEAQRLGRILRPKADRSKAVFYSLVTEASCDQEFSARRQLFLAEQGYSYEIVSAEQVESNEDGQAKAGAPIQP